MLLHYFKIAFRSCRNNKTQSLITLFSLAIAFGLTSLAAYWNRYEQTYDSFIAGHESIFQVGHKQPGYNNHISSFSFYGLHSHLMEKYPEVDKACGMKTEWQDDTMVDINNHITQAGCEEVTPEAVDIFGIQWVEGNRNMESWSENEVAISEEIARKVCGKESPVGLKLALKDDNGEITSEYQIAAVFKTWPQHSNFNFQILKKLVDETTPYHLTIYYTYVRFKPNADINLFLQKMESTPVINGVGRKITYNVLTPLNKVHYTFPKEKRNLRLNDVKLFTGAAMLLSVCALLNYLTLFVSRLRTKGRNMALRAICGSSSWQLGVLLMVEYLLLLLGALFFSLLFIELFYNGFVKLSQLEIDRFTLYTGCSYLLLFIFGLAALLSLVPILYFKQKTLRVQMETAPVRLGKNRFRIAGVCMQLFISLLFIFCSSVMIKQIHYLIHADINMERKNIAWVKAPVEDNIIKNILKQIPSVTEMVPTWVPLFPAWNIHPRQVQGFEGREDLVINAREAYINQEVAQFYGLRIKEGPESFDLQKDEVLINETFAKQLGDPNPIGKIFPFKPWKIVIKGIVHDFQYQNPTEPTPALYFRSLRKKDDHKIIAFKYTGDFADCKTAIEKAFKKNRPGLDDPYGEQLFKNFPLTIEDGETVYNSYLTSELNLLKLLNIITIISLLIALFGVYALILQECERQRKSIAVRKVFGAQVKDILMMFFKDYMLQVAIAAALAFPIGYVLMKHWLERYSRQTSIGIEVFLGIFLGMAVLVLLCIGWHVWRAANENPATAVKKE